MRRKVSHAASQRAVSEPIVVAVELLNGTVGYGETLPRPYVTGETNESVIALLRGEFVSQLLAFRAETLGEALEHIDALPFISEDGHRCPAARAAVELALLDATLRALGKSFDTVPGWLGLPGFGSPGSLRQARYALVLASESVRSVRRMLGWAWWLGMRNFKLKVGFADDDARMAAVQAVLGRQLAKGRATLRLDANAAWTLEEAAAALTRWRDIPIAGVEQPLAADADEDLVELRRRTGAKIIHDESLALMEDAERLHALDIADIFNVRISKCGGVLAALKLAAFARQRGIQTQLGCMVGETSILSSAGVRFLEQTPGVTYCEGAYGKLLMGEDVSRRSVHFGLGGRPPRLRTAGLVADVNPALLRAHCIEEPIVVEL
ncbi:MAG TPA: enolase C-terminal domain-like protein [Phycisphaerae bacterium]|nr:enolase C-terminal domain-like protein [Phycisphaerae bacterium]